MNVKSIKAMILGVQIMLLGGFLIVDPTTNLNGAEYLIVFAGLIIGIVSFLTPDTA